MSSRRSGRPGAPRRPPPSRQRSASGRRCARRSRRSSRRGRRARSRSCRISLRRSSACSSELPATADGLSGTERRALDTVAAGARTPPAAFVAAQRTEDAPFLGDTWFYRALSSLRQEDARLLETGDGAPLPPAPPLSDGREFARLRLQVTVPGERVLRRDADRVELLGIDRWVGGTHLTRRNVWRWAAAARRPVRG